MSLEVWRSSVLLDVVPTQKFPSHYCAFDVTVQRLFSWPSDANCQRTVLCHRIVPKRYTTDQRLEVFQPIVSKADYWQPVSMLHNHIILSRVRTVSRHTKFRRFTERHRVRTNEPIDVPRQPVLCRNQICCSHCKSFLHHRLQAPN